MVTCKNCKSINVRVSSLNFARVKPEGQPAAKFTYDRNSFYCDDCKQHWESDPEAARIYSGYCSARYKTLLLTHDMGANGNYGLTHELNDYDLVQRSDLAKKLIASYKHVLDLDPSEWHEIEMDAKE